jgi:hypothetical protein
MRPYPMRQNTGQTGQNRGLEANLWRPPDRFAILSNTASARVPGALAGKPRFRA